MENGNPKGCGCRRGRGRGRWSWSWSLVVVVVLVIVVVVVVVVVVGTTAHTPCGTSEHANPQNPSDTLECNIV